MSKATSLALAALLLLGTVVEAGYSKNVYRARHWLRDRTSDRAFACAHTLGDNESSWNVRAGEPWRADGLPQAYPGYKMKSAGYNWRWNATTQVRWGKRYVGSRYGTFCRALRFQSTWGWY